MEISESVSNSELCKATAQFLLQLDMFVHTYNFPLSVLTCIKVKRARWPKEKISRDGP